MLEHNGNPVPNRVNPLALIALQAFFPTYYQRLTADGTNQNFEELRGNHNQEIVTRKSTATNN